MKFKHKYLIYSIATFVPGLTQFRTKVQGRTMKTGGTATGGTGSAKYCYSVWLRHLVMAKSNGLNPYPKVVAELGPGNSLGIGLAALISGCDKYFAFDVVKFADTENNLKIFDELVTLFRNRAAIPGDDEFPKVKPCLNGYNFPADILDEDRLQHALETSRIEKIRDSISYPQRNDSLIQYQVPWGNTDILQEESVDMIYSQAVLEHVDDLPSTYKSMKLWLKSTGYISHEIDFKCHGTADEWNGHWKYSDFMWKLMRGKRPYLLNREPYSTHAAILKEQGFKITYDKKINSKSSLTLDDLASRFKSISDDDLTTSSAFIQAVKINQK